MVKKAKTRLKTEKPCKKLEAQIQEKSQIFLRNLQGVLKKSCDLNDSDVLLHTRNTRKSSLRKDSAFSRTNIHNEDTTRDNYMCYRCKHFLEMPRNLSQPFSDRVSTFVERCKNELSFIQAIVWLKSSITCASQIPVEQLQRIFNEQWNTCSKYNHSEDEHIDVEQLGFSMNKDLPIYEKTSTRDTVTTSTPLNISNIPQCVTSQRMILSTKSEDPRNESLNSMSVNDPNESIESSILGSSSSCYIAQKEKKKEIRFCIIPETDVESVLDEDIDIFDNIPEYQLSFEEGMERSVQNTSKNGIGQIKNKKRIENRHIFQKNHVDEPSERECILSARNQSIDPMFEYNYNEEHFISTKNQNVLADKVLEFDSSPKNCIITPKISQMSSVCDEYFELLLNDNSSWQASNTAVENLNDSAYSTSHIDIFNCDTAVETVSVTGNKRVSDTEHYYELQSCKKKTIAYKKKVVSSSINEMLTFDGSPRSLTITQKDMSQISNVYNDENFEFQITSSCDERMSNISSENLKDGVAVTAESIIRNKRTRNIQHCYKSNPRNEKTITRQKVASPFMIQRAVVPHTNIEHCYNLQASNNRKISCEKEDPSVTIQEPEKHKSGAWNLSKEENENEEMISANWLNFTMESLRVECVILASSKVILSTLCDKRTTEEYILRQQRRNMRNYWKDSLEEAAVNAVLNISDIFIIEKKPNICIKIIMMAIVKTLNEMTMYGQLYKIYNTQTSVWIYRVQIILEFCNSLPICVKITDYLITKLKLLQSSLTNVKKIQKYNCVLIKQLHLVFYALNITLRKYRTIISSDQRSRPVEKIPHVADLWKTHYIDKELKHTGLDLDAAEKQWLNTLENAAVTFTNFGLTKFAEKSFSLIHVLISQSSAKIT